MKNKLLLLIDNPDNYKILKEEEKESNITFLFPIKEFCVGFNHYFKVEELDEGSFIYLNRILDNAGIEKFKDLLNNLPSTIKGIVFDDLGILNVLNTINPPLKKILFLNHFNCNYASINAFLEYVDSVIVSLDITLSEIDEILKKATKPLVLYTFGVVNVMYSRRNLISNYNAHFQTSVSSLATLEEKISTNKFYIIENPYGTVIYPKEPMNALSLRNKDNVLYNLINTSFLNISTIQEIIHSSSNLENKYPYHYLTTKPTIVKIKDGAK